MIMVKSKDILIIDNYKKSNSKAIKKIIAEVTAAGYNPIHMRHDEAEARLFGGNYDGKKYEGGEDITNGKYKAITSGSGTSLPESGKTYKGKPHLTSKDRVARHLAYSGIDVLGICGGGQNMIPHLRGEYNPEEPDKSKTHDEILINTKKKNMGYDETGRWNNHQYGILAEHLEDKVDYMETFEHEGHTLAKKVQIGNNLIMQYHPEKTEKKHREIKYFLNNPVRPGYDKEYQKEAVKKLAKGPQAADDYHQAERRTGTYG